MKNITNQKDLIINWRTHRDLPSEIKIETEFPSYNIYVSDLDGNLLETFTNIKNEKILDNLKIKSLIVGGQGTRKRPYSVVKSKLQNIENFTLVENYFEYLFENNLLKFIKNNNKLGFYKNLKFKIEFNNKEKNQFEVDIEYASLTDLNNLFKKVYRSNDNMSVKLLLDKAVVEKVYSFLIITDAPNSNVKLKNLFVEDIKSKWLDNADDSILLTVPFSESYIIQDLFNINIKVIPLNKLQSDIYSFMTSKYDQDLCNSFVLDSFNDQISIFNNLNKSNIEVFYQGFMYLFTPESFEAIKYPNNYQNIALIDYKNYFPLANNAGKNTICLIPDVEVNQNEALSSNYIQEGLLGVYELNSSLYKDVNQDFAYLQQSNIKSVEILEVTEFIDDISILVQFNINSDQEDVFVETYNSNLKFIKKFINQDGELCLVFKYTYSINKINYFLNNNPELQKNQIILDKDLISFKCSRLN